MSAYLQTQQILGEESLISDELRIVAKDTRGLSQSDRVAILNGAQLIEYMLQNYAMLNFRLCEAEQRLRATSERLREANATLEANCLFPVIVAHVSPVMMTLGNAP